MYNENQKILLLLDSMGVSKIVLHKFIEKYSHCDYVSIFKTGDKQLEGLFKSELFKSIKTAILCKKYENIALKLQKMKIFCLFYGFDGYPENYKNIKDSPIILYTMGNVQLLKCPKIAIIGSRKPTKYGKDVVKIFTKDLASCGIVTVSDLAYGIDGLVASETIEAKGKHTNLARDIVNSGGLIISEHCPGVKAFNSHFLERNRLLAGLCDGLLVVEASKESATMNTVAHAINFGKELFVVPGNITSDLSSGTNKLISEIPHSFTISPVEIIERLGISYEKNDNILGIENIDLTDDEKAVIEALYEDELSFDELQETTKINAVSLSSLLTSLEINGLIKKLPGNYYSKN